MELVQPDERLERLRTSLSPWSIIGGGPLVVKEGNAPTIFPAYAKVHHSFYEDRSISDRNMTWENAEKAGLINRNAKRVGLTRISMRQAANNVGLPYSDDLTFRNFQDHLKGAWPAYLVGPTEDMLDQLDRSALAEAIEAECGNLECYYYFWFLTTHVFPLADRWYRGPIREVDMFPESVPEVRRTPMNWFPADGSWIVRTGYDMHHTDVGGSESFIAGILNCPNLDAVKVGRPT